MNFPFRIARRYLFAKKSTNAINIITGISVLGLSIGTAALILVLSVMNGFEDLITGLFSNFNPDVKVTPAQGKTFDPDSIPLAKLQQLPGVKYVSQTVEEVAFFEYKNKQDFGIIKGVDIFYSEVTGIDTTVREGGYVFSADNTNAIEGLKQNQAYVVLGVGMRNKLGVSIDDYLTPVAIYMPKSEKVSALQQPFRKQFAYPSGTFVIQQEFDNQYVLSSLRFAQDLMNLGNKVGALEIQLQPEADTEQTLSEIRKLLGDRFVVKDRYQQDEAFLKLMNIEKWMSFAILSFALLLVAFNLIGSLWMIVVEKRKDIAILKSMGATDNAIRNIFLNEGLLLCSLGLLFGFFSAILFFLAQQNYGLIPIPDGFVVSAYPMSLRWTDFIAVALMVVFIGLIASIPAALRAKQVPAMIREE